ncbi:MAG TPA: hypothetical protein VD997_04280 [Phycisphaerales bacterium]|nr:hypothetical protein [Phycisphaerales bacterium]
MIGRMVSKLVRVVAVVVVAGAVAFTSSPAQAQWGGMGMDARAMDVSISRRTVDAMTRILMLDKDQKETVLNLHDGYKKDYEAAQNKMTDGMKGIQEKVADTGDFTLFQKEIPKLAKEFSEKSRTLETTFLNDVKLALTEPQLAKWPQLERYRRRDKMMRVGVVSGAAVDLIRVVDRLKLTATDKAELDSLLERYELDIDKSVSDLERMQKEMEEKFMNGDGRNMMDIGKIQEQLKALYEPGKAMRETNKEYTRKIGLVLDEKSRERFEAEVKARGFPRVYRQAHVIKQMEAAEKLEGLDKGKKDEIAALRASYLKEAASTNERWAKAIEERDDKAGGTFAAMMSNMTGGGGELNKDVNEARQARKELDAKTKEKLESLLTEEQWSKLPAAPPEPRGGPWADMMPQPDDEDEPGQ